MMATHMTDRKPQIWPVILPVNMPCSVYGDIFCFNPSIFSISVFSRLKFRFNSLFCKGLFHSVSLFFDVHPSEIFFLFAKIISKASRFSQVQDSNFSPSKIFENVLFCLLSFEMLNSQPFFVFWIIDYWLNFSFADRAAGSWWTEGWLFSCPK